MDFYPPRLRRLINISPQQGQVMGILVSICCAGNFLATLTGGMLAVFDV
ncbi:hypothetical protein [Shewanella psychrotolerans]|nr:hypothetical protein [Shewanella psychrotolerans]QYK00239.1 hypothetical protein K0I62_12555 [Shewanella psychrotolerans]